jgi:ATP-dependent Clp protease ATP-binding subunit ClpA
MQASPEIENIIERSIEVAKQRQHMYVTIEHLLWALITHPPFKKCLKAFNIDVDLMTTEVESYLDGLHAIKSDDPNHLPKKTNTLERAMNRAVTQVLFTGRRQVATIDLFISISTEGNSHGHYFLLKYGVSKAEFLIHWQKSYSGGSRTHKPTIFLKNILLI